MVREDNGIERPATTREQLGDLHDIDRSRRAPSRPIAIRPCTREAERSYTPCAAESLRGDTMRLQGAKYCCAVCGEVLDIPADAHPRTTLRAASGQPTWRVLTRDNKEIHRCEMPTRPADWYPAARVAQAQGIVSVQANCSTIAALAMMQERARVQDRPLDELAQTILDGGERFYSRPRDH